MIPQVLREGQAVRYRLSAGLAAAVLWAVTVVRVRSLARDAQAAVTGIHPPLEVRGAEQIPAEGPCLIACNHYSRPGFAAWWIVLAISAAVASRRAVGADKEIHWVMTERWTFPSNWWRRRVLGPVTRWLFERVAQVYGFVTMPPMPPAPDEVEARALAVRRTLRLARQIEPQGGMIGLAPEGRDTPGGGLGDPPQGVGAFVALLVGAGLPVLPVGVAEVGGRLRISFGPVFVPDVPRERAVRDEGVALQVMAAIARQMPAGLVDETVSKW